MVVILCFRLGDEYTGWSDLLLRQAHGKESGGVAGGQVCGERAGGERAVGTEEQRTFPD